MTLPQVSVVVPTHNRQDSIVQTIQSLQQQTYPAEKYELIIVDDASTDDTAETVEKLAEDSNVEIRLLIQEKKGPAAARNLGIKNSASDIVAFTDSDARADQKWLAQLMAVYSKKRVHADGFSIPQERIAGVGGRILIGNPEHPLAWYGEVSRYPMFGLEQRERFCLGPPQGNVTCNMSWKKEVLLEVGLFNEDFKHSVSEDTELGYRIYGKDYKHIHTPEAVVYHNHPTRVRDYMRTWYNVSKHEVLLTKKYSQHPVNSPFRLPNRRFLTRYPQLIFTDLLVRASMAAGLVAGILTPVRRR